MAVTPGPASYGPAPVTPRATASRPRSVATPRRLGSEFVHAHKRKDDLWGSKLGFFQSSLYNQASFILANAQTFAKFSLMFVSNVFVLGNCDCNYSSQLSNIDISNHWNSAGFFVEDLVDFFVWLRKSVTCNVTRVFVLEFYRFYDVLFTKLHIQ